MKLPLILLFSLGSLICLGQSDQTRIKQYNLENKIIAEGYDVVSYFQPTGPKEGTKAFKYSWRGVDYLFASASNLELFKKNPEKYDPAYGGWCAYAMGKTGEKVKIDPETFKIVNNKLYLFYNFWGNNTLKTWNADERNLLVAADKNWATFFH